MWDGAGGDEQSLYYNLGEEEGGREKNRENSFYMKFGPALELKHRQTSLLAYLCLTDDWKIISNWPICWYP